MKNLANCKPSEFLVQTNRIRKSAENWLTVTDIMNIRRNQPELKEGMTKEERQKAMQEQVKKNLSKMFDAMLEAHAKETLELLALLCFVEPENVDDYPISDYLEAVNELLNDKAVLGFFTSLVKLGQKNT
jgi:hypothetical protein